MRLLIGVVIFLLGFLMACGAVGPPPAPPDGEEEARFTTTVSDDCSDSPNCQRSCDSLFSDPTRLKKCKKSKVDVVSDMKSVVNAMESGSWDGIKSEELASLIKFDDTIWLEYASINSKVNAREMLLWVAEQKKIGKVLYGNDAWSILEAAFKILASSAARDDQVQEGLKTHVELDKKQSYLEVSALADNDDAFKAAHELLKEDCEEEKLCMKTFYCEVESDPVFSKLNELELTEEVVSYESGFNRSRCR